MLEHLKQFSKCNTRIFLAFFAFHAMRSFMSLATNRWLLGIRRSNPWSKSNLKFKSKKKQSDIACKATHISHHEARDQLSCPLQAHVCKICHFRCKFLEVSGHYCTHETFADHQDIATFPWDRCTKIFPWTMICNCCPVTLCKNEWLQIK